jgi:hypothetical protein
LEPGKSLTSSNNKQKTEFISPSNRIRTHKKIQQYGSTILNNNFRERKRVTSGGDGTGREERRRIETEDAMRSIKMETIK